MYSRVLALSVLFVFLFSATSVSAASLSFSASTATVGQTFSVPILVSTSGGESLNAISATISYPSTLLSLVSIAKSPSVITLWAQEPTISAGTASLEGIVPNPGYSGSGGRVATLTFRVLAPGTASLSFANASVLANDGSGTDILTSAPTKQITLNAAAVAPVVEEDEEPVVETAQTNAPGVTSAEFPAPNSWYARSEGTFSWNVPDGVTAVRTLLDQNKTTVPSILLDGRTSSRSVAGIPEGVNYFHVQFKNAAGWGEVAHVRVAVDITPPTLSGLTEIVRDDLTDPRIRMRPTARDTLSGLAGYEVSVDGGAYTSLSETADVVTTAPLAPGEHRLLIRAVDGAGNVSQAREVTVTVVPLTAPAITFVTDDPKQDEPIVVSGTSSLTEVTARLLFIQGSDVHDAGSVRVSSDGTFSFLVSDGMPRGAYSVAVYVEDARGARSEQIVKNLTVHGPGLDALALLLAQIVGALFALAAAIGAGMWLMLVLGKRLATKRNELLLEIRDVDEVTRKAFQLLKKDVSGYAAYLKRQKRVRDLTGPEQDFLTELSADLLDSEKVIRKELGDVATIAAKQRPRKTQKTKGS